MFTLRSSVLRVVVLVAAMAALASAGPAPGLRQTAQDAARMPIQQEGSRRLQEATDSPMTPAPSPMREADVLSMAPTAVVITEAPTAAPTSVLDRALETEPPTTSGAASWAPSSLLSPAAIFVGSVAAAMALV